MWAKVLFANKNAQSRCKITEIGASNNFNRILQLTRLHAGLHNLRIRGRFQGKRT